MKQNSSILFHHMRKLLKNKYLCLLLSVVAVAICAVSALRSVIAATADKPEYIASFDPAKGFKPAQSDLTEVFLQIAGSLEYYGSPEPYLRHMKAEHERIEAKYRQQTGDKPRSFRPAYMDAAYFDRFSANWQHMAAQLGLESLAKTTGHLMRTAINGPDSKGTILVNVFDEHQHEIYVAMTGKKPKPIPEFDTLQTSVMKCLELDGASAPIGTLTAEQQAVVNPAREIHTAFLKLFSALDIGLSAADATKVEAVITSIVIDVGRMAQSELEIACLDHSLDELRSPTPPYSAEQEFALNAEERKIYTAFLKKPRFTKADFPALDKFYKGPYDRLTERGKDEMSHRFWEGMREPR